MNVKQNMNMELVNIFQENIEISMMIYIMPHYIKIKLNFLKYIQLFVMNHKILIDVKYQCYNSQKNKDLESFLLEIQNRLYINLEVGVIIQWILLKNL